jgi:hypothetical protein
VGARTKLCIKVEIVILVILVVEPILILLIGRSTALLGPFCYTDPHEVTTG